MSTSLFVEQLRFITAVTEALNGLPSCDHFYIRVELRHENSHEVAGQWSDEIAPDAWYFEEKGA